MLRILPTEKMYIFTEQDDAVSKRISRTMEFLEPTFDGLMESKRGLDEVKETSFRVRFLLAMVIVPLHSFATLIATSKMDDSSETSNRQFMKFACIITATLKLSVLFLKMLQALVIMIKAASSIVKKKDGRELTEEELAGRGALMYAIKYPYSLFRYLGDILVAYIAFWLINAIDSSASDDHSGDVLFLLFIYTAIAYEMMILLTNIYSGHSLLSLSVEDAKELEATKSQEGSNEPDFSFVPKMMRALGFLEVLCYSIILMIGVIVPVTLSRYGSSTGVDDAVKGRMRVAGTVFGLLMVGTVLALV